MRAFVWTMLQFIIEKDLLHLERIVQQASDGTFPFTYWHARIDALRSPTSTPPITRRIDRLKAALSALEARIR
ncbi:hypothetical protein AWB80_05574 [Caballeronia pedi]|uniref:Uncharacterized protein n=1 Tax=Caballeronia pedi TaxID=1777141 RepID=A0A158CNZ5_9BURK|nr:hypothetical protein AWB80_05574 [Caballeronia pedi]